MTTLTHAQYLRSHRSFVLAEVFEPAQAPFFASRCLLPVADVFPEAWERQAFLRWEADLLQRERQDVCQPYLSVWAFVHYVGEEEVGEDDLSEVLPPAAVAALCRRMRDWPRLWRDPVRRYLAAVYDVELEDPPDPAVPAREASATRREDDPGPIEAAVSLEDAVPW